MCVCVSVVVQLATMFMCASRCGRLCGKIVFVREDPRIFIMQTPFCLQLAYEQYYILFVIANIVFYNSCIYACEISYLDKNCEKCLYHYRNCNLCSHFVCGIMYSSILYLEFDYYFM